MRNSKIVYLRAFAMLLVVLHHSLCFYTPYWHSTNSQKTHTVLVTIINAIDMPIFMFISGFLFGYNYSFLGKYQNKKEFIINKIKHLLVPYLFWGIILCVLMPNLYSPIQLLTGISHLWFLLVLFLIFLITIIGVKLITNIKPIYLLFLLCFFCGLSVFTRKIPVLGLFTIYFPIFLIGILSPSLYNRFHFLKKINKIIAIIFFLSIIILISLSGSIIKGLLPYIGTILAFFLLFPIRKANLIENKWLRSFDECSMGIYILHHIVIKLLLQNFRIEKIMINHIYFGPCVLFIITVLVSWTMAYIIKKQLCAKYLLG